MNKKILILMIPMLLFGIIVLAEENSLVDNKLIKIFEVNENQTIDSTILEEKIEYLGENYLLSDVKKEKISPPIKEVQEIKKLELSTNNKNDILTEFPKTIMYDDNEFSGELEYEKNSLKISPISHGNYEKVSTLNRKYTNLKSNDLINIPKEILQDDITYVLTNCKWSISETQSIANIVVPKSYTANTTYKAVKKIDYPYTYMCSLEYKGNVSQKEYNNLRYTVTYIKDTTNKEKTPILPILGSTGVFIIIAFLIFPNAKIKNYSNGTYKTQKYVRVSCKKPTIDLRNIPAAKSNVFLIEFNNQISKKLQGQFVTIATSSGSIKKMIINNSIEVNI